MPKLNDINSSFEPYLIVLSDTSVQMNNPSTSVQFTYKFTRDPPHDSQRSDFFTKTTSLLVKDLLCGRNGLCLHTVLPTLAKLRQYNGEVNAGMQAYF
jgi:hypothetical protein